jgi:hypothetical protein
LIISVSICWFKLHIIVQTLIVKVFISEHTKASGIPKIAPKIGRFAQATKLGPVLSNFHLPTFTLQRFLHQNLMPVQYSSVFFSFIPGTKHEH